VLKRSLLLLLATLLTTPLTGLLLTAIAVVTTARADTLWLGYLDPQISTSVVAIDSTNNSQLQHLNDRYGTGFGFGQFRVSLTTNADGTKTFETEWNDGFVPPQGGTIWLYGSWQGAATASGTITLPSIYQVNENRSGAFTIMGEIFLCGIGQIFCDNYYVGGGTLVGTQHISTGNLFTDTITLTGLAPGQPFTINEVFSFSQDRCCIAGLPQGDAGAAILTTPSGDPPVGVPAPVVGAGWPALMLGLTGLEWLRRRRQRATK
jgi:hypothetical protein